MPLVLAKVWPEPPPWGVNAAVSSRHERSGNEIRDYLNTSIETFLVDYREHLPEPPASPTRPSSAAAGALATRIVETATSIRTPLSILISS